MRLDAHQHFWKYTPEAFGWVNDSMAVLRHNFYPEDLKQALDLAGIAGSIAVQASQSIAETLYLLSLADQYPWIAAVVGWVDLLHPGLDEQLHTLRTYSKLKGFRHLVQDEPDPDFLLRPEFVQGVRLAGAAGYTYDILVREHQLGVVPRFLELCPDQPMVLDHLGKPVVSSSPSANWKSAIRAVAAHPQVYCKISGLVTEADWQHGKTGDFLPFLEFVAEAFGTERLMFGSDWPVCLLAVDNYAQLEEVLNPFLGQLSAEARAGVEGLNAARFYNIS